MSRLDEALRRAGRKPATPDSFNVPSVRALDWFTAAEPRGAAPVAPANAAERESHETAAPVHAAADVMRAIEPASPPAREVLTKTVSANGHRGPFDEKLVTSSEMGSIAVEQYRRIAAVLHHAQRERHIRVVMIASALPAEGKTLTAVNLAFTMADSYRRRVLLVDADLRRPMIHDVLGIENRAGLNEVLNAAKDGKLTVASPSAQLSVLTAGRANPDPMSSLTSERMKRVITEAAELYDWVIIDTPPLGLLPDANLLASMVDAAVLVVGAGRAPLALVEKAIEALGRERIVGVVLNKVNEREVMAAYEKGGYYHYYAPKTEEAARA